jgi:hypothetical protein
MLFSYNFVLCGYNFGIWQIKIDRGLGLCMNRGALSMGVVGINRVWDLFQMKVMMNHLPGGLRFFLFGISPNSKIFNSFCVLFVSNEQSEWVVKNIRKTKFHHRGTESKKKLSFFDLPGEDGRTKSSSASRSHR